MVAYEDMEVKERDAYLNSIDIRKKTLCLNKWIGWGVEALKDEIDGIDDDKPELSDRGERAMVEIKKYARYLARIGESKEK